VRCEPQYVEAALIRHGDALAKQQKMIDALMVKVARLEAKLNRQYPPVRSTAERDTIRAIAEAMALAAGLTLDDMTGRDRTHHVSHVRQAVMHQAHLAGHSTGAIGRALGGRDHSTVVTGIKAHLERL
jgi:chromosomal replication initiation ATPase DnaA